MRYMTTSSEIGPSTMRSIFPFVLVLTQSLIVGAALAAAKSSPATRASKYCFDSSRNVGSKGKPARYQTQFAIRKATVASSVRSRSMSDRYDALISDEGAPPNASAER